MTEPTAADRDPRPDGIDNPDYATEDIIREGADGAEVVDAPEATGPNFATSNIVGSDVPEATEPNFATSDIVGPEVPEAEGPNFATEDITGPTD